MEILHHFPGSKYIPNELLWAESTVEKKTIVEILFAPDSSVLEREERQWEDRMNPLVVA